MIAELRANGDRVFHLPLDRLTLNLGMQAEDDFIFLKRLLLSISMKAVGEFAKVSTFVIAQHLGKSSYRSWRRSVGVFQGTMKSLRLICGPENIAFKENVVKIPVSGRLALFDPLLH